MSSQHFTNFAEIWGSENLDFRETRLLQSVFPRSTTAVAMEQVLYRLHVRILAVTSSFITPKYRTFIERCFLLSSLLALGAVINLHLIYVKNAGNIENNCIKNAINIQKIPEALLNNVDLIGITIQPSDAWQSWIETNGLVQHALRDEQLIVSTYTLQQGFIRNISIGNPLQPSETAQQVCQGHKGFAADYLFSHQRGVLMLTQESSYEKPFSVLQISLSRSAKCLGKPVLSL